MERIEAAFTDLPALLKQMDNTGERVVIASNGEDVAILVPIEDLEYVERAIEDEEHLDIGIAAAAAADPENVGEPVPWEESRRALGI